MLTDLHISKPCARRRASSYDRTGGNHDSVSIPALTAHTITLDGPGIIRHIWMTLTAVPAADPTPLTLYQDVELAIRFDNAAEPQVQVPLADFFLFGHGSMVDVNSTPIQVSRQPVEMPVPRFANRPHAGSLNCYFPMPFDRQAIIELRNRGPYRVGLYYYVDWEQHESLPEPALHFHATLNEEQTRPPAGQPRLAHNAWDSDILNPDWKENYIFLDVQGYRGHYVGTSLSIECRPGAAGKWWEGDDMFVIDDEPWPPRLHGTGTEDYFNLAWGFRKVECRPEYGVTCLEKGLEDTSQIDGRFSMYRFHISDPIPFTTGILASIEHGHANDCEATYRSVAYWYGRPI